MNEKRRSRSGEKLKIRERKNSSNKDADLDGHVNTNSILDHDSKLKTEAKFGGSTANRKDEGAVEVKVDKHRKEESKIQEAAPVAKEDDKLRELNDKLRMRKRVKENIKENTEEN